MIGTSTLPEVLRRDPYLAMTLEIAQRRGRIGERWFYLAAGAWRGVYALHTDDQLIELAETMIVTPDVWETDLAHLEVYYPGVTGDPDLPPTPGWRLFYAWWAAVALGAPRVDADPRYRQAVREMTDFNACLRADGIREDLAPTSDPDSCSRWFDIIESYWGFDQFPLMSILDEHICRPAIDLLLYSADLRLVGSEPIVRDADDACRACGQADGHADRCRIGLKEKLESLRQTAAVGGDSR